MAAFYHHHRPKQVCFIPEGEPVNSLYLRLDAYSVSTLLISPFVFNPTRSAVPSDYKLAFARQMLRYQKESMSSDPDKAGLAMTMMGIGLRSKSQSVILNIPPWSTET